MKMKTIHIQVLVYYRKYLLQHALHNIIILQWYYSHRDFYHVTKMNLEEGMMLDAVQNLQYPNNIPERVAPDGDSLRMKPNIQETKKNTGS